MGTPKGAHYPAVNQQRNTNKGMSDMAGIKEYFELVSQVKKAGKYEGEKVKIYRGSLGAEDYDVHLKLPDGKWITDNYATPLAYVVRFAFRDRYGFNAPIHWFEEMNKGAE